MKKFSLCLMALLFALSAAASSVSTIWKGEFYTDETNKKGNWVAWKGILDLPSMYLSDVEAGDKLVFNADRRDASNGTINLQVAYVDAEFNWIILSIDSRGNEYVPVENGKYTLDVTSANVANIRRGLKVKGENAIIRSVEWISEKGHQGNDLYIAEGSFHTSGTRLLDANNQEFVMRGCNYSWCWQRGNEGSVIPAAKRIGCNAIRIQLGDGKQYHKPSKDELEYLIKLCEKNKLIAVFNTHDETGSNDINDLVRAANFWIEMKDVLNAHTGTVIVNISNEWYG